ncbi:hypothetical protein J6590_046407 [Homalodisca vitripennis]|nr:hypothetical protein J6590_046407 [Homalodisca vitripennis]
MAQPRSREVRDLDSRASPRQAVSRTWAPALFGYLRRLAHSRSLENCGPRQRPKCNMIWPMPAADIRRVWGYLWIHGNCLLSKVGCCLILYFGSLCWHTSWTLKRHISRLASLEVNSNVVGISEEKINHSTVRDKREKKQACVVPLQPFCCV